jgi:small nuclear ribonucleoprotein (snRNP)-like protein
MIDSKKVNQMAEEYHTLMYDSFMRKDILIVLKTGEWVEGEAIGYDASHNSWIVKVNKVYLNDSELEGKGNIMSVRGDTVKFVTVVGTLQKKGKKY